MEFKSYKLSELVKRKKVSANIESDKTYKRVTVKLYHKGVVLRDEEIGSNIKSSMFYVSEGDFILSGIDARNGAFGIVPKELEGAVITNDFWCLEPIDNLLDKEFFLFLTSTSFFDYICKICSDGTTQRIRLQKDKFFDFEISIPSLKNQKLLVEKLKTVNESGNSIFTEITHQLDLIKNLRQAFLREAMQGLLVSNETSDNKTGADLLAEIQAEKAQLVKEKKIKKPKPLAPITEEEIPFDIPENWTWCRLGELGEFRRGPFGSALKVSFFVKEGIKVYEQKNAIYDNHLLGEAFITEEKFQELKNFEVFPKDLIVSCSGATLGRIAELPENARQGIINQALMRIRLYQIGILNTYFIKLFRSPYMQSKIFEKAWGSAIPNMVGLVVFKEILIPLPPLEIQERLVAKLDELMGFCDALEEQVKQSQQTNELLLQQVLREALGD